MTADLPDAHPCAETLSLSSDRLKFLRHVAWGNVTRDHAGRDKIRYRTGGGSFVGRKTSDFERAGLIHLIGTSWQPTVLGAAILAADDADRAARQEARNRV